MDPMGFSYNGDGSIVSDTPSRCSLVDKVATYIFQNSSENNLIGGIGETSPARVDITDIVLQGMEAGAYVCPNYTAHQQDGVDMILIPISRFKVSRSSFNIYASYKKDDGFATMSLLQVEDGSANTFTYLVPAETKSNLNDTLNSMSTQHANVKILGTETHNNTEYNVYSVSVGLEGAPCNYGEAFANYVAYNVALYNIGSSIFKNFIKYGEEDSRGKENAEGQKAKNLNLEKRYPKFNVMIEHEYFGQMFLNEAMSAYNSVEKQDELISRYPGASLSVTWLDVILTSDVYKISLQRELGRNAEQAPLKALKAASQSMLMDCDEMLLAYSLELLSIRYYLHKVGFANDPIGQILGGGGVDGNSISRRR